MVISSEAIRIKYGYYQFVEIALVGVSKAETQHWVLHIVLTICFNQIDLLNLGVCYIHAIGTPR